MPKVNKKKRNSATSDAAAKAQAAHSIFKMNTDIGQHVLKNPGIAEQYVILTMSLKCGDSKSNPVPQNRQQSRSQTERRMCILHNPAWQTAS